MHKGQQMYFYLFFRRPETEMTELETNKNNSYKMFYSENCLKLTIFIPQTHTLLYDLRFKEF